jgi:hypothetical protein
MPDMVHQLTSNIYSLWIMQTTPPEECCPHHVKGTLSYNCRALFSLATADHLLIFLLVRRPITADLLMPGAGLLPLELAAAAPGTEELLLQQHRPHPAHPASISKLQ